MISPSTFPAPTLGSWSQSPTMIRRVPSGKAFKRAFISHRSTIDISSIMTTSVSRGFSALYSNAIRLSASSSESSSPSANRGA